MKIISVYMPYGQVFVGKQLETIGDEIILEDPLMVFISNGMMGLMEAPCLENKLIIRNYSAIGYPDDKLLKDYENNLSQIRAKKSGIQTVNFKPRVDKSKLKVN